YGRTLRLSSGSVGEKGLEPLERPTIDKQLSPWAYSNDFSWIPTDFQLGPDGQPAKALGYINNVHPNHGKDLIETIEALVGRFSLLWDKVLTDLHLSNERQTNRVAKYSTQGRRLQIYVRVSGIEMTPENPEYTASPWTVVGRANERVVASGVYYYDSDNATEPGIEFRMPVSVGSTLREPADLERFKETCGLEE
ncbi:hypothetical protein FRB90_008017, partial [Tulasnella sp. 427]